MTESITATPKAADPQESQDNLKNHEESGLSEKRLQQHQRWMRVMMEGQSTPDNRYIKSIKV